MIMMIEYSVESLNTVLYNNVQCEWLCALLCGTVQSCLVRYSAACQITVSIILCDHVQCCMMEYSII